MRARGPWSVVANIEYHYHARGHGLRVAAAWRSVHARVGIPLFSGSVLLVDFAVRCMAGAGLLRVVWPARAPPGPLGPGGALRARAVQRVASAGRLCSM